MCNKHKNLLAMKNKFQLFIMIINTLCQKKTMNTMKVLHFLR